MKRSTNEGRKEGKEGETGGNGRYEGRKEEGREGGSGCVEQDGSNYSYLTTVGWRE